MKLIRNPIHVRQVAVKNSRCMFFQQRDYFRSLLGHLMKLRVCGLDEKFEVMVLEKNSNRSSFLEASTEFAEYHRREWQKVTTSEIASR